ncbi:carbohydrate-binding protein [Paenibacillus alkalitolerans]|uniref:carbohydrate-binding protein n=1 Tax=Paenibacillus alkalitolerans TaxID=2799335 RepID=UPI0018F285EE|nr:carbohydrate-binding protein [Paenibacillus alkalitolerans]
MQKKWSKFYRSGVLSFMLAFVVTSVIIPTGKVRGEGTLLKTGNYIHSPAPDGGNSPDWRATGIISSANGVLFDGGPAYAGWMGSATSHGTVNVIIDLLKDYPLDEIRLALNSPNKYWGFKDITVKYRPESATGYYIAARHVRAGTELNYSVTVPMSNKTARFIVLNIRRTQAYQHIPLTEVEIYRGVGLEGQNAKPAFTAEELKAELKKEALLADKYGQWMNETWPGKVTSDAQLQREYADEAAALANVSLDLTKYDQYGGIKCRGKYANTGYFRLQNIDGKWWFITPDGYPFIVKGVDATSLWEYGYKTSILKPDGTLKQIFEELPDRTAYAPAYTKDANGEYVNFVVANVMKKYGSDYEEKWEDITKKRLIQWGFNTFSKWTKPKNITFPYIQVLNDPWNLRRILWSYDVFDPQSGPIIENALKAQLHNARYSKWLIGYAYDNEAGWDAEIVKKVLTYSSTSPAKSAFVDFLAPRYNNNLAAVNRLLGTNAASFDALKDIPINIANVPAVDVSEYIRLASRTYYSMIRDIIKKYDPNHLFLGTSIVPTWRTSLDWDQAAMPYVDAFSVDSYTRDGSWISRYEAYGKPLLNLEYSFGSSERGLSYISAATMTTSVADRGRAFQTFVESQAEHPLFVGSGWFSYFDQPVTGRPDGESYNLGLVNQQDQPYTDMVNIMKTAHSGLENIHSYGGVNLSMKATVAASPSAKMAAGNAVDGNSATRWASNYTDNEWIYTDLGAVKTVNKVRLNWEGAYGKEYKIQVSGDSVNWRDVFYTNTGNGGIDEISFAATEARYVRMLGLKSGTLYGFSLWDFEVYAPPSAAQAPTSAKIEAEGYSSQMGIATETLSGTETGLLKIGSLHPGDWAAYSEVNLTGMKSIDFRVASAASGTMRVRLGSPTGTVIGTFNVTSTGGWQSWVTSNVPIAETVGTQNVYFTFEGVAGQEIGKIDYFVIKPK